MKVNRGFLVFKKGDEISWVTPHSGPAFETPTSRDDNSDTVASICWMRIGGKLIVSTMSRKRAMGIDFNRTAPSMKNALEYYSLFDKNELPEKLQEYRGKYAWVAKNKYEHVRNCKIYRHFWDTIKGSGRTVVFIHRKFTRLKNFPSIMDIVVFQGYGFSKKIIRPIIAKVNRKYAPFFEKISQNYKDAILLEEKRAVERMIEIYGSLDPENISVEYKAHMAGAMKIIEKYSDREKIKLLQKSFSERNYIRAVRSALRNVGTPKVTIESIFKGEKGRSETKGMFKKKNVISIESNAFLNYWYPSEASDIILDIVNEIRPMRKITEYLVEKEEERSGSAQE